MKKLNELLNADTIVVDVNLDLKYTNRSGESVRVFKKDFNPKSPANWYRLHCIELKLDENWGIRFNILFATSDDGTIKAIINPSKEEENQLRTAGYARFLSTCTVMSSEDGTLVKSYRNTFSDKNLEEVVWRTIIAMRGKISKKPYPEKQDTNTTPATTSFTTLGETLGDHGF